MQDTRQLTEDQLNALSVFARLHGRNWKSVLRERWMTGNYSSNDMAWALQQVRNQFGPSWLVRFKLHAPHN